MIHLPISARKLALLAQVPVTVTTIENRSIAPALFGIGTGPG